MKKSLIVIALLSLIAAGCNSVSTNTNQAPVNQPAVTQTTVSYLVSPDINTKYCDGVNMDSAGYKKSLTIHKTQIVPGNLTKAEIAKQALILASKTANLTTIIDNETDFVKIVGDTAYMKPIDGWAGVSIFMCAWQPLVEANLQQFPEIKQIIWINDPQKWDTFK
jgi:hypothetical protein